MDEKETSSVRRVMVFKKRRLLICSIRDKGTRGLYNSWDRQKLLDQTADETYKKYAPMWLVILSAPFFIIVWILNKIWKILKSDGVWKLIVVGIIIWLLQLFFDDAILQYK